MICSGHFGFLLCPFSVVFLDSYVFRLLVLCLCLNITPLWYLTSVARLKGRRHFLFIYSERFRSINLYISIIQNVFCYLN